ncbi:GNAT family N-acetyltransferase [Dictyobacter arantiisoli]|uniref:N-acetyltransferase n=1 Tax=Dictyobacter arantiisoli TaxID=2014874 RepID=A0A5A5TKM2_9CHLR|nr:GNAT family N-acetyltransferase [Dictyobacter arantiisoli]GCF11636.1 N-acetyltransferase [Dictyobacter arantiisoli]
MHIRFLHQDDSASFHMLRLHGSQEAPDAFDPTYEEEQQKTLREVAENLQVLGDPPEHFVLGAFDEQGNLLGTAGFTRDHRTKMRHKGLLWGVYVMPPARRQGIARMLLQELIQHAQQLPDLEQIHLSIIAANVQARELYSSLGFQSYGLAPRAVKQDGLYLDEELMILLLDPTL